MRLHLEEFTALSLGACCVGVGVLYCGWLGWTGVCCWLFFVDAEQRRLGEYIDREILFKIKTLHTSHSLIFRFVLSNLHSMTLKQEAVSDEQILETAWLHARRVHAESAPDQQYLQQVEEEIRKQKPFVNQETDIKDYCVRLVKSRWTYLGIWNPKWHPYKPNETWKWRHQEPREHRHERNAKLIDESRPINRFIHEMREVKIRMRGDDVSPTQANPGLYEAPDVNSDAYRIVRQAWEERQIWYWKWSTMPGECWLHEYALEDVLRAELGDYIPVQYRGPSAKATLAKTKSRKRPADDAESKQQAHDAGLMTKQHPPDVTHLRRSKRLKNKVRY